MAATRRAAILVMLLLAACAEFNAAHIPPGMGATEVRGSVGAPSEQRTLPDGTSAWYYVFGFSGFTTYRVRFDANQRVIDAQQVLTDANFRKHLVAGQTTQDDVLNEFGKPGQVSRFPGRNEIVWTYRWRDVTLEMLADLEFDATTAKLRGYALYRDPAYVSGLSQ